MSCLQTFQVFPYIPEPLKFLEALANNLWWCWNLDAIELFRRINPKLWDESGHNPIVFLTLIEQKKFNELSADSSFLSHMEEVREHFIKQVAEPFDKVQRPGRGNDVIAYFPWSSAFMNVFRYSPADWEPLAGDHLKASSDLGIPVVGIGLLYRNGYFHQF